MECERFKRLFKSWFLQVQDEALAPARMVELMENHISECPVCIMDPDARRDMEKIITLVLPQDKLKIASRSNRKKSAADPSQAAPAPSEEAPLDGEEKEEGEEAQLDSDEIEDDEEIEEDSEEAKI